MKPSQSESGRSISELHNIEWMSTIITSWTIQALFQDQGGEAKRTRSVIPTSELMVKNFYTQVSGPDHFSTFRLLQDRSRGILFQNCFPWTKIDITNSGQCVSGGSPSGLSIFDVLVTFQVCTLTTSNLGKVHF